MAAISVPAESISGLDATSGHTISARPEFVGHASETPLEGMYVDLSIYNIMCE